jgi:putative spermidine/putrescine transport system substrate-binding protein
MMKRLFALVAALVLGSAPALAQRELTIVAGGGALQGHMRGTLFQSFTQQTGIALRDASYDYNVGPIRAMVQANNVTWDVVMVEAPDLIRGCEDGIFERMDWSVVNREKFLPGGTTTCGAGAIGWGVSMFRDLNRHPTGPSDWREFFDVQRFPGRRALRRGARMTLEIALMGDGVPRAEVYRVLATPEGQRRAFAALDRIRPHLHFWTGGQQPLELVNAGEVAFAAGFVGRTANAIGSGARLDLNWDTLLYAFDYWAVVRGSPHRANAMRLVEHITNPGPLRALSELWAINAVTAEVANDPAVRQRHPRLMSSQQHRGLQIDTEFWLDQGPDLEQRFAAWLNR